MNMNSMKHSKNEYIFNRWQRFTKSGEICKNYSDQILLIFGLYRGDSFYRKEYIDKEQQSFLYML